MANEFRAGFDELARQAELDELRKEVDALRRMSPLGDLHQHALDIERDFHAPIDPAASAAPADAAPGAAQDTPAHDTPAHDTAAHDTSAHETAAHETALRDAAAEEGAARAEQGPAIAAPAPVEAPR
jgi:sec-independent protein translocase protein TatB